MADLNILSYQAGDSLLHRFDARCKLTTVFLLSFVAFQSSPPGLAVTSLVLLFLMKYTGLSLLQIFYRTRLFYLLLAMIVMSRSVFTPGDILLSIGEITFSREGLLSGALYCWRLHLILYIGIIFVSTTRTSAIRGAVSWFLKPVPMVPERRVAIMVSLMIRFLPLILEQAKEISDAQKARAVENVRNPVKRMIIFAIPLMRNTFETVERFIIAMEARCYSEDRTDPELMLNRRDLPFITAVVCYAVILVLC